MDLSLKPAWNPPWPQFTVTGEFPKRADHSQMTETPVLHHRPGKTGRAVSVRDKTVVKVQEPAASRKERLRTLAGKRVGEQTGLFVVPDIVSFNDAEGEIVFERLPLIPFREALSRTDQSFDLIRRAAMSLAGVHGRMASAEVSDTKLESKPNSVPLHGDFGMHNVCYLPASDEIALIDWANAGWTGVESDVGEPEIDVAVFLVSLFHRRPLGPWPVSQRHELARHFLEVYASTAGGLSLQRLRSIVAAIAPGHARMTRRLKGRLRALSYYHSFIDLYFFLGRLRAEAYAVHSDHHTA